MIACLSKQACNCISTGRYTVHSTHYTRHNVPLYLFIDRSPRRRPSIHGIHIVYSNCTLCFQRVLLFACEFWINCDEIEKIVSTLRHTNIRTLGLEPSKLIDCCCQSLPCSSTFYHVKFRVFNTQWRRCFKVSKKRDCQSIVRCQRPVTKWQAHFSTIPNRSKFDLLFAVDRNFANFSLLDFDFNLKWSDFYWEVLSFATIFRCEN